MEVKAGAVLVHGSSTNGNPDLAKQNWFTELLLRHSLSNPSHPWDSQGYFQAPAPPSPAALTNTVKRQELEQGMSWAIGSLRG